ncbi:MAG: hypothetical protein AAB534_03220 [Patescibacteria group bacterium]
MVEFEQNRTETASFEQNPQKQKAWGPTIGLIIILLLIIAGSLYFFRNEKNTVAPITNETSGSELEAIENDLSNTDSESIDSGINSAEQEINQL